MEVTNLNQDLSGFEEVAFCGIAAIDDRMTLEAGISPRDVRCCQGNSAGAMVRGSIGFAVTSVAGFAVWAFAGRELSSRIGEGGLCAVIAVVYLGLTGLLLHPLVGGRGSLVRFYRAFIPAFAAYSVVWSAAWFAFGFGAGEWLGSLAGCAVFAVVTGWVLGNLQCWLIVSVVLFATHSVGYFLGGKLMYWMVSPAGLEALSGLSKAHVSILAKLGWGLLYGLGMGAGLGYTFFKLRKPFTDDSGGGPPHPDDAGRPGHD